MKKRILFVDDEPNILQALQRMLRDMREEWDMHFAGGGEEALDCLARQPFDVVVSDMRMPGMDGAQFLAKAPRRGEEIPLGARILKVALDFDALETAGNPKGKALEEMKKREGRYDPRVLAALEAVVGAEAKYLLKSVAVLDLEANMILAEDVKTIKGLLLVTKGQELSKPLLERMKRFVYMPGIQEPIQVIIPMK